MHAKKKTSPLLIVLIVLVLILAALVVTMAQFFMVDLHFYPRNAEMLDLRGEDITPRHYEKLAAKLPDCEIYWDVPFQGTTVSSDVKTVTVTALRERDVQDMAYLKDLETVDARQCRDYAVLQMLEEQRPELTVDYTISLGGEEHHAGEKTIVLSTVSADEIGNLAYLRSLEAVTVTGGENAAEMLALQDYCHENGIGFAISLGGEEVPDDTRELTVEGITDEELNLLPLLQELKKLHMASPKAAPEHVLSLSVAYPHIAITWDQTLGDVTLDQDVVDVDLSEVEIGSVETVETALRYLPEVEAVFMGEQDIDHEEMAAYRDRVREDYKVVWYIRLGNSKPIRTDITYFMPGRDGPVFNDDVGYNIRYCEDLVAVDVGHLGVHDTSWVGYLTNLEYLILSHTGVTSIEGIENCKKLKFLEITDSGIRDLTPLKECTALEDLNFSKTWPDVSALKEMPWLKNIYMIFGSGGDAWELSQALPDTRVVASGERTTGSGWRKLPNYYAMRDALHAYYMD